MTTMETRPPRHQGFALVATLTLLILLTVIGVGLLGLSTVSLRNSSQGLAQAEARANARMALMIAIGELQKHAGPDTRITAPADILDDSNPPLTGVWKSWEGTDHGISGNLAGRPIAPDYGAKNASVAENGRFLTWLVSRGSTSPEPDDAAALASKTATGNSVPLVAEGSLEDGDERQVHVEPVIIESRGGYAWWVSPENQKARVPKPHEPSSADVAGWSDIMRSHTVADPKGFALEGLLDDPTPAERVFTLASTDLIADARATVKPAQSFHDISAISVGLLTNTATGGWRKDLSLLTEKWDEQPYSGLPLFQLAPGQAVAYTRPVAVNSAAAKDTLHIEHIRPNSVFYPWNVYRNNEAYPAANDTTHHRRAAVYSWENLVRHATLYKHSSLNANGIPSIKYQTWSDTNDINSFYNLHNVRVFPQMARLQVIVSHLATDDYAVQAPGRLRPCVLYTPVITLWNPYNYEISPPTGTNYFTYYFHHAFPIALQYDSLSTVPWSVQNSEPGYGSPERHIGINSFMTLLFAAADLTLKPGETRVFSPRADQFYDVTYANKDTVNAASFNMWMAPGVRYGGGQYYGLDRLLRPDIPLAKGNTYISDNNLYQNVTMDPGASLQVKEARFDVPSIKFNNKPVSGMHTQWSINSAGQQDHGHYWCAYDPHEADELYPPLSGLASTSLAQCREGSGSPVPFLSMLYGSRIASENSIPTKGVVQGTPAALFGSSGGYTYYCNTYPGMDNLLNSAWEFSYVPHGNGPGDDMFPNADITSNSGYIVTGVQSGSGIKNLIMTELPYRPLTSIADLTHWWIRGMNPAPPHSHNIIGNSDATPLIPRNDVVDRTNNPFWNDPENEQQDDSYCANHLLFDDWFFSSIAPQPVTFGPAGQPMKDNFIDFLTGVDPLANRAYKPIAADKASTPTEAGETYNERIAPVDSWRTIASRLEVEGMFNVNSTSLKAWRALLGHARNQKVPYYNAGGNARLSVATDHALPRTSVAGHEQAGALVGGSYFATTEFAGYRVFTSEMLDALAENVVEQVRARGPFLSLSEFVNRQLDNDEDLAIGGAIQVALNKLAEQSDDSLNPFSVLQDESVASSAVPPGQDDYVFGKAAEGHNTYGLPGWPRQVDVLRPLAPILSARDDTFTIRAYGDARSPDGKILARAWCEASIRRTRDFCNPGDEPDIATQATQPDNLIFGRKFQIVSFRWLPAGEI